MKPTATIITHSKAAFLDAIKKASLTHVTEIHLSGYTLRVTVDPIAARTAYNQRELFRGAKYSTPFEVRFKAKLRRMTKAFRAMSIESFNRLI